MTNLVDRYLLFRIRKHQDSQAFARIYDRYVAAIYRFVLLKLPSKEDAEDLTSDTFLKCWRYVQEHHDIRDIRALLYQIARNAVVDWYRQRALSPRTLAVTFQSAETSSYTQEASDAGKSSVVMEARAELALVMGKLERLKDEYRDVLTMRLIDGLPFAIIAEILRKKPGSVRVVYHRAKKALDALDQQA
ncbi:MAG TPA: RNA polymerase sigma factor [Candidatus Methylomirabilis sp.]|nr:RNA polymerase sigma factor [Candidatus Methylomirabilis sp.]